MLDFQPMQLEDLPRLRDFFNYSVSRLCDTTAGTAFIWRDMYRLERAVYDGSLYCKATLPETGDVFTLPLGGGRTEHYTQIAEYCRRRNIPAQFYPVPKAELERLEEFFPGCIVTTDRNSYDYLYRAEGMKFFKGKKLSGQRNHVNKFHKTYSNWTFRPIEEADVPAILNFLEEYAGTREKEAASYHEDLAKSREVLENLSTYDMLTGLLLVEDRIAGFSVGEILGDTLFVHIEKADRTVEGGYQMLVSQFAQRYCHEAVAFINREDDAGDPGLRTSKLSYHPVALLEKYTVVVPNP